MKTDMLLDALGEIGDAYIEDAAAGAAKRKKRPWMKWGAVAACLCLIAAGIFAARRMFKMTVPIPAPGPEPAEKEEQNADSVSDTEPKETVPLMDPVLEAAFGYLFPREIEKGYTLSGDGIVIYGDSPRVLQADYENAELNDTLHVRIAPDGYFGEIETGTVLYGERTTDGTRPSALYYQNAGMTVQYRFDHTDMAALDAEAGERLYDMIRSARCFVRPAGSGSEQNDEYDLETLDAGSLTEDAQRWSASMKAADYFKNSDKGGGDSVETAADLVMSPYAVYASWNGARAGLEESGVLPVLPEHDGQSFSAMFNGDGSLYKVEFLWMRRGTGTTDGYSDLCLTAAPKELHELSCVVYIETDGNGNVIPPYVTVTERDGVPIYAEGRENQEKTLTWETDKGWFQIGGSWNDTYEDVVALFDWFWEHPLDLGLFADPPEGCMIFSTRAEHPEAFSGAIPDFESLGYAAESERVHLGTHWNGSETAPVWFEGIYTRGDTRIRWTVSVGADGDAWDACLGRPREIAEERLNEALTEKNRVNLFFDMPCMATVTLEAGEISDVWEIIRSLSQ